MIELLVNKDRRPPKRKTIEIEMRTQLRVVGILTKYKKSIAIVELGLCDGCVSVP